jgi:hypothetical protein
MEALLKSGLEEHLELFNRLAPLTDVVISAAVWDRSRALFRGDYLRLARRMRAQLLSAGEE